MAPPMLPAPMTPSRLAEEAIGRRYHTAGGTHKTTPPAQRRSSAGTAKRVTPNTTAAQWHEPNGAVLSGPAHPFSPANPLPFGIASDPAGRARWVGRFVPTLPTSEPILLVETPRDPHHADADPAGGGLPAPCRRRWSGGSRSAAEPRTTGSRPARSEASARGRLSGPADGRPDSSHRLFGRRGSGA